MTPAKRPPRPTSQQIAYGARDSAGLEPSSPTAVPSRRPARLDRPRSSRLRQSSGLMRMFL